MSGRFHDPKNKMNKGPSPVSMAAISGAANPTHRERTKVGIARARSRGVKWGAHGKVLAARNRADAETFAETLRPQIIHIAAEVVLANRGCPISSGILARELNARGIPTRSGSKWHPTSVRRLLARLGQSIVTDVREMSRRRTMRDMSAVLSPGDPGWKRFR